VRGLCISHLLCAAHKFFHVGHLFGHTGRQDFGAIVGDQDSVFNAEVHLLVGELDDGFDCDHLASFHRACGMFHVVSGQAYEVSGETVPLIGDAIFFKYGLAGVGDLLVGVSGLEQGNGRLLRLKIDGIPLGLLRRELAADVESASNVHGHVIEIGGEVEHYQFIRLDLAAVVEIMPGVDVLGRADDGRVSPALSATIAKDIRGLSFDLILVHRGGGRARSPA